MARKQVGAAPSGATDAIAKGYVDTRIFTGVVAPAGAVSASPGTLYIDTNAGKIWYKDSGTGTSGWFQVADVPYVDAMGNSGTTALNARIATGLGTPEGVVTATVGTIFKRSDGAAGTAIYVKETGTGNTGWVPYASKTYVDAQDTAQAGQLTALEAIVKTGTNSPEGVVTATVGSIYKRTNGAAGTAIYVKETGTGNTGWVAYASKAYMDATFATQSYLDGILPASRPQLRVHSPASVTSVTTNIPYGTVLTDSHSGWSVANKRYTVPVAGLWHIVIQSKCAGTAAAPAPYFVVGSTTYLRAPAAPSVAYGGIGLSGYCELAAGDICFVRDASSYATTNDTTGGTGSGSNYLHMTWIGPA